MISGFSPTNTSEVVQYENSQSMKKLDDTHAQEEYHDIQRKSLRVDIPQIHEGQLTIKENSLMEMVDKIYPESSAKGASVTVAETGTASEKAGYSSKASIGRSQGKDLLQPDKSVKCKERKKSSKGY